MPLEQRVRIDQRPTLPEVLPSDLIAGSRDQQAINWTAATLLKFITDARVFEQPDGTDFNALLAPGTHFVTTGTNAPVAGAGNRWAVEVIIDPTSETLMQRASLLVGGTKLELASRRRLAGGTWEPWLLGAGQAVDVGYDDSNAFPGARNVQEALEESANYTGFVETEAMLQNFVYGLILGNWSGTTGRVNFGVTVSPGQCRGNGVTAARSATWAKMLNAAWVKGFGFGGLDTGTIQPNTTYHCHAIRQDSTGDLDFLFSTSATSPVMPSGWTHVQRLGAVMTDGSGNIRAFIQTGNEFRFNVTDPTPDYAGTGNRAKAPLTCTLPNGIRVQGLFRVFIIGANGDFRVRARLFDGENTNVATDTETYVSTGVKSSTAELRQYTNTSRQIQLLIDNNAHPSTNSTLTTLGWIDYQIPRIGA